MKRLLAVLALALLPATVNATTFYVDAARADDTGDGLSWGAAKKTIAAAMALARADAAAPHTMNIKDGTYAEQLLVNHANLTGMVIAGQSRTGTIVAPAAAAALSVSVATGGAVRSLTLKPSGAWNAYTNTVTGWTMSGVDFLSSATHSEPLLRVTGGDLTVSACRFWSRKVPASGNQSILLSGTASLAMSYSIIAAAPMAKQAEGIYIGSTGTVTLYNNVILDAYGNGVEIGAAATVTLKNNVIMGPVDGAVGGACIKQSAGTVSASRNYLIASAFNPTQWIVGAVTEGAGADANIKTNADPRFRAHARVGYIIPRLDDSTNFAYTQSIEAVLAARGMKGSYYLEQAFWQGANTAALRAMVAAGTLEVGTHTYSHTSLTSTGKIFDVTKGAETITTNRAAGTITLSGGGSVTDFRTKSLAEIKTALEGLGATVTPIAAYTSSVSSYALGEIIADGAGVNVLNFLVDATAATGLFKAEMADPKAWTTALVNGAGDVIDGQTGAVYVCNTLGNPYNAADANTRAAAIAAGFTGDGSTSANYAGISAVTDADAYLVWTFNGSNLKGADEAATRGEAAALAFAVAHGGLIVSFVVHNATELTVEQWGWILDEFNKYGSKLKVTSLQILAADLRTAAWTADGDGTFSRTYGYSDYHPGGGSPLINAGMDVSLTTDFDGLPILNLPDIGAFEARGCTVNRYPPLSTASNRYPALRVDTPTVHYYPAASCGN